MKHEGHFLKIVTLIFDLDLERPWTSYQQKGLLTSDTHVKYEGPQLLPIKQYGQCKNVCWQTNGQTDRWTDKRTGQKLNDPDLSMRGGGGVGA